MSDKKRLDIVLFERGFAESREKAKALIMSGIVYVNDQKEIKAGRDIKTDDVVEVRGSALKYVSRGGLKLEKAMKSFDIILDGAVCADIGASTGGFTECLLMHGAKKVFAVDSGVNQLSPKLKSRRLRLAYALNASRLPTTCPLSNVFTLLYDTPAREIQA